MPKMSGEELARNLIAIRPDIPVIMCTGYSETMNKEKALQSGIRAFVMKPLGVKELAEALQRARIPSE